MFKIITDTPANLPVEIIKQYEIEVIPLHYTISGKEYPSADEDPSHFDGKWFYDQMRGGEFPHTSMINAHAFSNAFEKDLAMGHDIIYIGISSGVSGTYHAAAGAAAEMKARYPERKIAAIDTRAAALGEGLIVLFAANLKKNGATFEEVVRQTEAKAEQICQYFTVEDLTYLKRGGRISGAAALVGNILHIKPILMGNEEGKIVLSHKTRGRKKAFAALEKVYRERVIDYDAPIGITHGDCLEDAEYLAAQLKASGQKGEILIDYFEPVTGSHAGPGALALFFFGIHR